MSDNAALKLPLHTVLAIQFKATSVALPSSLTLSSSLYSLASYLSLHLQLDARTLALYVKGGSRIDLASYVLRDKDDSGTRIDSVVNLREHFPPKKPIKALLTGSSTEDIVNMSKDEAKFAALANVTMSPDQERRRAARRAGIAATASSSSANTNTNTNAEYTFGELKVLQYADGVVNPPPEKAMELLRQLAEDSGVRAVMQKHKYKVNLLSEMHPEGKVGVSEVCVLGYNVNQGQEISLRLRTDDLRGFRRLRDIKLTLMHELAHNEYREHDENFKTLNSLLVRELEGLDWRAGHARTLGGTSRSGPGSGEGWLYQPGDEDANLSKDGRTVGGDAPTTGASAAASAAAAAMRRAAQEQDGDAMNE
ncbi:WLM domain-containing protein [Pseudoscourfieldia marina]